MGAADLAALDTSAAAVLTYVYGSNRVPTDYEGSRAFIGRGAYAWQLRIKRVGTWETSNDRYDVAEVQVVLAYRLAQYEAESNYTRSTMLNNMEYLGGPGVWEGLPLVQHIADDGDFAVTDGPNVVGEVIGFTLEGVVVAKSA